MIEQAIEKLRAHDVTLMKPAVDEQAIEGLKFSECVPHNLVLHMLGLRLSDPHAIQDTLERHVRFIYTSS